MSEPQAPQFRDPFYYHRLPNGMELIGQRMPSLGSVVFSVQADAGALNEPDDQLGLCQLLEDMFFQGTPTRTARRITDAVELLGARRVVNTSYESMRLGLQVVHTRLSDALELVADLLLNSTFPQQEFTQLKPLLLQAIRRRDDEPMRRAGDLIAHTYYRGSRMSRPLLGTVETASALDVGTLKGYYDRFFHADRAVFAIAGNFEWDAAVASVERLFGGWSGGGVPGHRDVPQPVTLAAVQQEPGEQEHIYLAYPSVAYGDPDYYANLLAVEIFGGGMTSRLFDEVREKRSLVYSVGAYAAPARSSGAVMIYGGSSPDKAHETVKVIVDELKRLETDGVTQDELDRAKVQLMSELVMQSESSAARMSSLLRSWWFERRLIPIHEVREAIDAVTTDQILQLQRRFPPTSTLVLAAVGPVAEADLTAGVFPPQS
jgi:predicted Zn-dependent peptidase